MKKEIAVFGGGCFWCTEAVFKMLKGVSSVEPGYAKGKAGSNVESAKGKTERPPTYEQVSTGLTPYAESVEVRYDPHEVSYRDLLTIFFASHDPASLNRQGDDVGPQYRSAIFYTTEEQRRSALEFIKEINSSNKEGKPVVTTVELLGKFYAAEDYHRDYFRNHADAPYCQIVINPKLEKVQKEFSHLLKTI